MYFERQGLATVVVGGIRLHLEKVSPPRALWVPFELGRPLGGWIAGNGHENQAAADDVDGGFQLKVLRNALSLLDQDDSHHVIADFELEDPSVGIDPGWQAPSMAACKTIRDEVHYLYPDWQEWQEKNKGSKTGLCGMEIADAVDYVERFGTADAAANPGDDMSDTLRFRFAVDDIKTFYFEAAMNRGSPDSKQLGHWLWHDCKIGELLNKQRLSNSDNENDRLKLVYEKFLVPGAWQ